MGQQLAGPGVTSRSVTTDCPSGGNEDQQAGSARAASRAALGSTGAGSTFLPSRPAVISKPTATEMNQSLMCACPLACHGLGPESWSARSTARMVREPRLTEAEAKMSTTKPNGENWISAS